MKHTKIFLFVAALCATMLSQAAEKEILNETFASGQGAFTIENVDLGSLTSIWRSNTRYGNMSASAYVSDLANASEAWLISPAFDLANCTTATLTFDHAAKFQNGTVGEEFQVYYAVSPSATFDASEWTNVTIPDYPTAGSWTYVSSGEISLPINATKIAFRYKSTATAADTWQVKNVKIVGQNDEAEPALPIALPNIGEPTLVVCAQNLRNYFNYVLASKSDCSDWECLRTKTSKIADVFCFIDADIYAMCELEANDTILKVLTDSLNGRTSDRPYAYVADGISDPNYSFVKSGFIYRKDKVKTVGSNNASTSQTYYKYTMRYQMFEELATGERFTLSMNHFKAKTGVDSVDNAKRVSEATDLVNKMKYVTADPDILIMGDLNCEINEEPLQLLVDAGYEEQLLRFDSASISHCYSGSGQLIDHAFANSAMAAQITGASVYHICTSCSSGAAYNSDYRYSDHDPYLIGLKLTSDGSEDNPCEDLVFSETFATSLGGFSSINVSGTNNWYVDTNYHYAKMYGAASDNNEDWLVSPALDLSKHKEATLTFDHAANKGTAANKTTMQTLWMSADYIDGDPSTGTWTQVTIPTYPAGTNWTFVNSGNIDIPAEFLVKDMHFAFKYVAATASEGSCWEIKNVVLNASCSATAIEQPTATEAAIFAANGRIYGDDNMRIYTVLGLDVTEMNGSLCGVYIVKVGNSVQKIIVR